LLGIVLSPTVFASLTGLVQEMQATPPASGKKSRAVLANALDTPYRHIPNRRRPAR
jgi:hypothetical protein